MIHMLVICEVEVDRYVCMYVRIQYVLCITSGSYFEWLET